MPELPVLSPRSGGPSKEATRGWVASEATTYDREAGALGQFRGFWRGFVPSTASLCWTWDGQKVGTLGQFWEFREGPWA